MRWFRVRPARCLITMALAVATPAADALAEDAPVSPATTEAPSAAGAPATPDEAGPGGDVMYLTDGRVLRGTVVEAIPDVEVRIRLATGEVVSVARREILHFEHTGTPPEEGAPLPPALRVPPRPVGWVHMEGSDVATLQHEGRGHGWVTVCSSPCNMPVPTEGAYRIVGPGLKTSDAFALGARDGEYEVLRVHGASRSAVTTGIVVIAVGLPVSLTVAFGTIGLSAIGSGGPPSTTERTIEQASVLAGGISVLVGVGLLLSNLNTVASQSVLLPSGAEPPSAAPTPYGGSTHDGPRSAPSGDPRTESVRIPSAVGAPLFVVRF